MPEERRSEVTDSVGSSLSGEGTTESFLPVLWALAFLITVFLLLTGVRDTDQLNSLRYVLHTGYAAGLIWHLGRSGSWRKELNEPPEPLSEVGWFRTWVPALVIGFLFLFTLVSEDGVDLLLLSAILATLWTLVAWWREVRLRSLTQGIALGLMAFLCGLLFLRNGVVSDLAFFLFCAFVPLMYVAGGLFIGRTGFGGLKLGSSGLAASGRSFLWGCLLFVPFGLFNSAEGSPGQGFEFVTEWWMPLVTPWFSGIAEETLWRLFLMGLCFFLLRPLFRNRPFFAAIAVILFSGIAFGVGHGLDLDTFLTTGLLYGVPLAAVFTMRDWEHAVGAHYMINMLPTLAVFFENVFG